MKSMNWRGYRIRACIREWGVGVRVRCGNALRSRRHDKGLNAKAPDEPLEADAEFVGLDVTLIPG